MTTRLILVAAYSLVAAAGTLGVLRHVTIARRRRRAAWREWYRSSQPANPSVQDPARWSSRV